MENKYPEFEITVNGKHYRHDYESDVYYRCDPQLPESRTESAIKVVLALLVLVGIVYFFGNH